MSAPVITIRPYVAQIGVEVPAVARAEVAVVGLGARGPAGTSGAGGYTHTQSAASATWTINHNLGRKPAVTLLTTGGVEFEGQVTHTSDNQAVVSLAAAIAGTARCS